MVTLNAQVEALKAELADCRRQLQELSENAVAKEAQLGLMSEARPVAVADAIEKQALSEQGLRSVIELMPAVVAVFDGEFRLAAFNPQLVDHFRSDLRDRVRIGATLSEMAALLMKSVVWFEGGSLGCADYGKMSDDEIDAYMRDQVSVGGAGRTRALHDHGYETRDGRFFRSRTSAFLGGGIVRVGIDVTEEWRDRQRFQEVVSSLADGVLLFDSNYNLRLWSPSMVTMFGFLEPMMIEGASADDIRAAIRSAAIETDHFEYHGFRETQHQRRYPDGRIIHFREIETKEGGLLITCSDQSDLSRALGLASRVERMEALGRLVAGVAHEIGTPLGVSVTAGSIVSEQANVAMERLKMVSAQDPGLLEPLEAVNEASSLLNRSLSRTSELVDSFKRVSVDEMSDDYRSFRLAEILNDVATMLRPQLRLNGHELEIDCPPEIMMFSYPGAISQIVTNFVSNSLVHAYPDGRLGGRMWLQVRRSGQNIKITYRDDGVGVRSEILGRIFEHFFTTRRGIGGSGLGLGIVHNLTTELMGGSIEAISPPGSGLQIQLRLPARIDRNADLAGRET